MAWRIGSACAAREAEGNRDGLDNLVVAGEGRRVGGLFYFIASFRACPLLALSGHGLAHRTCLLLTQSGHCIRPARLR